MYDWTEDDAEVWEAMRKERDAGHTRLLGVSNVSLEHLEQMAASQTELPAFVQNRCFARTGWDREVRAFCDRAQDHLSGILAAHRESGSAAASSADRAGGKTERNSGAGGLRFARAVGMLPLTGTTNAEHMKQDLASLEPDASARSRAGDRIDRRLTRANLAYIAPSAAKSLA